MNINQVKAFTWLVSAAVTAGLGYYVFEFIRLRPQLAERRITREQAEEYLTNIAEVEGPKQDLLDAGAVQRAFRDMNWAGKPPPPPPVEVENPTEVEQVSYDPMSELLVVMVLFEDPRTPGHGRAWVKYLPASGVEVDKGNPFLHEIRVGQRLPQDLSYVTVKAITVKEGVTFSFDDAEREDESLLPDEDSSEIEPFLVDPGGQPIRPTKGDVPRIDTATFRPKKSVEIKDDSWIIGLDDAERFAEDYGGIIAREVNYGRHRNPKTGKYDGIELKSVKQGGMISSHGGQAGDIIKSINGHPVTSPAEAITYIKNHKDEYTQWTVVIENKGRERTVVYSNPQ